jgi:hypothetical protein
MRSSDQRTRRGLAEQLYLDLSKALVGEMRFTPLAERWRLDEDHKYAP